MGDQLDVDPVVRDWLSTQLGEAGGSSFASSPLTALSLLAGRRPDSEMPAEVVRAWRRLIVRQRRVLDQSEDAFIRHARGRGLSWDEVAEELGHGSGSAAAAHHARLVERLQVTHPEAAAELWND
ncbi:hypothetical protein H4696_006417 [Amycolatopsis lexingtonensis]|uniref:Uncharacterized protein n=1 Tax=Amycolatopsis lexingtonensis TaxID=218822 RepID=A0ABR9I809_9PSEU|nr:hypothetical protein [Amycolatopsis lexingtonensis]MBE1499317.1 hypothetical protein [Amycolatopsis lexingtonensis]